MAKKPREPKPGELRAVDTLEILERMFKRPESRFDAQKMLTNLPPDGQAYARHLVTSGPMSDEEASKELEMTPERFAAAVESLEKGIKAIRK